MGEEGPPKTEMINPALLDGVSANFIVKGPNGVEKAFPMRSITVVIGRSDACEISVKDSSMSGKHAEISKINGEIRVKDLGSANGIWLNGERVDDVELYDGDVLRCGQTSIRVDVVGQTPPGVRSANGATDYWIDRILGRPMSAGDRGEIVRAMAQADSPDAPLGDETFARRLSQLVELILMSRDFQWR